ncbi:Long-chain-fatty-acid--CoA ligase [Anaerovibrio sp. JC8]|uniref:class I adenylate-forming enzyme family protein n=1 Tax=Anaerovibrio sp. JC8 TaxID=1240085 RepID=UPI000A0AF36A|nr:class I adenylate-forming enzyme family protein [Anaerovibrio sp. JC8]ORU00568.1 Long-chain-fatty-acid--CoA ligase [Anaerovibrio sp. JC8]
MNSIVEQVFIFGLKKRDKVALQNGKSSLTYGGLLGEIIYARKVLVERYHIERSSKVILAADKQIEFVAVYFACHLLEAVAVPIAPDTNAKRYALIKEKICPALVVGFSNEEELPTAFFTDFIGEEKITNEEQIEFPSLDSVADIIFTTGTTGEPKGVQLSHRNIAAAARNINAFIKNTTDDVEMLALPIAHSFGLNRMKCALSNGQTLVLLGSFANIKRFYRFMGEYRVNGFGMVPASWALLKKLSGDELEKYKDNIHYIEIGSAPMSLEDKHLLMDLLPNTRLCMHYGLTEASRSAFMEFHDDAEYLDTVGKESPNMIITVRDELGRQLPPEQEGEICVSGDAVTIGYLDLPPTESFWGDAFRTGDWGSLREDGYLCLKSRKKELINVGGKKVSPIEIEEVLNSMDFVEDCACIGVTDPAGILGEVVKAFVVTESPEKLTGEHMDVLIGNRLEGYKHPAIYEQIDVIPKTSSGKIQRLALTGK